MITGEVKRSFTKWLSGSKANAELPYPPEKKSASDFSRACGIFRRGITAQNLTSKNRPYPAENEFKNTKNYAVIFKQKTNRRSEAKLHEVAKRKQGNAELPYPPEKKNASDFFKGV